MKLFDRVVVAADAPEIRELCEAMGAPVVMTDVSHPSGTDRVAQVVGRGASRKISIPGRASTPGGSSTTSRLLMTQSSSPIS
jgi:hypothetical protein